QVLFESTLIFYVSIGILFRFAFSDQQKSLQPAIRGRATLCPFGKPEMVSTIYSNVFKAQGQGRRTPHSDLCLKDFCLQNPVESVYHLIVPIWYDSPVRSKL
ncbi:hypothetical protein KA005_48210, partial [bacterium]|nr:hypothetical protein [bacterium]